MSFADPHQMCVQLTHWIESKCLKFVSQSFADDVVCVTGDNTLHLHQDFPAKMEKGA